MENHRDCKFRTVILGYLGANSTAASAAGNSLCLPKRDSVF